jgi:hypothetical protein
MHCSPTTDHRAGQGRAHLPHDTPAPACPLLKQHICAHPEQNNTYTICCCPLPHASPRQSPAAHPCHTRHSPEIAHRRPASCLHGGHCVCAVVEAINEVHVDPLSWCSKTTTQSHTQYTTTGGTHCMFTAWSRHASQLHVHGLKNLSCWRSGTNNNRRPQCVTAFFAWFLVPKASNLAHLTCSSTSPTPRQCRSCSQERRQPGTASEGCRNTRLVAEGKTLRYTCGAHRQAPCHLPV